MILVMKRRRSLLLLALLAQQAQPVASEDGSDEFDAASAVAAGVPYSVS